MTNLDPLALLEAINGLVQNDFCAEMEAKTLPKAKEYTQRESRAMAGIIAAVYHFSHQTHCEACREDKPLTDKAHNKSTGSSY